MGGEKFIVHVKPFFAVGSPPRGRGKAGSARCASGGDRITPAWAGKSTGGTDAGKQTQDHPRVGGEKTTLGCERQARTGSPPRGRGKARTLSRSAARPGITPAWAGKRVSSALLRFFAWDHPRVGGEKFRKHIDMLQAMGSPPRGRGKASGEGLPPLTSRITPAWAGKSRCHFVQLRPHRDHPRVGGEKTKKIP